MDWSLILNWGFLIAIITAGIRLATPVLLAVLGEIVTEKSGVLNLGVDGIMAVGGVTGFLVTYQLELLGMEAASAWIGLLLGAVAGMAMGLLMSWLSVSLRADQVVSGVTLVVFGHGIANFIYREAFHSLAVNISGLPPINLPFLSRIPVLGPILFGHDPTVYMTVLLVFVVWYFLNKTTLGLSIRAAGEYPPAVETAGVSVIRLRYTATIIGCALVGLGGAVLTVVQLHMFREGITGGRGWIAIALVIFSRWRPGLALLGSVFFGLADAVQFRIQTLSQIERGVKTIPYEFLLMLPYVLTLAVLLYRTRRSESPEALGQPYLKAGR